MEPYKIDIALGDAHFTAEGPEEAVTAAYKDWLALVREQGVKAATGELLLSGPKTASVPMSMWSW